jgi:hypothetical protein
MTARHATVLLGALARAVPRTPILLAASAALGGVVALAELGGDRGAVLALQASTVALAGAAVTLLQEPRGALDAVPTTRARRRALVLGAGLPPLALFWMALLVVAGIGFGGPEAAALTLQLTAVTALALGLGARGGDPARAVAEVALVFGVARVLFGPQLFPAGTEAARWAGARGWWAGAACVGAALLAAFSRDAAVAR